MINPGSSRHTDAQCQSGPSRARALDDVIAGTTSDDPLHRWAQTVVKSGPLLGLSVGSLPDPWHELLGWTGMPLVPERANHSALRWETDLGVDATLRVPEERDGRLWLPEAGRFAELSGVELVPLRRFVARRLGVRLQTAPLVRLWLWADGAVLVSGHREPLGGFLYAPTLVQRISIMLEPDGWQTMTWN